MCLFPSLPSFSLIFLPPKRTLKDRELRLTLEFKPGRRALTAISIIVFFYYYALWL